MKGNLCCFVIVMQIGSWVWATSKPFPANDGHDHGVPQPGTNKSPQSLQVSLDSKEASLYLPCSLLVFVISGFKSMEGGTKGVGKMGSSPPSCEHKCYGCIPCEPIQVPSTSSSKSQQHVGVQYANYEPEGWKCKCGSSFYTP